MKLFSMTLTNKPGVGNNNTSINNNSIDLPRKQIAEIQFYPPYQDEAKRSCESTSEAHSLLSDFLTDDSTTKIVSNTSSQSFLPPPLLTVPNEHPQALGSVDSGESIGEAEDVRRRPYQIQQLCIISPIKMDDASKTVATTIDASFTTTEWSEIPLNVLCSPCRNGRPAIADDIPTLPELLNPKAHTQPNSNGWWEVPLNVLCDTPPSSARIATNTAPLNTNLDCSYWNAERICVTSNRPLISSSLSPTTSLDKTTTTTELRQQSFTSEFTYSHIHLTSGGQQPTPFYIDTSRWWEVPVDDLSECFDQDSFRLKVSVTSTNSVTTGSFRRRRRPLGLNTSSSSFSSSSTPSLHGEVFLVHQNHGEEQPNHKGNEDEAKKKQFQWSGTPHQAPVGYCDHNRWWEVPLNVLCGYIEPGSFVLTYSPPSATATTQSSDAMSSSSNTDYDDGVMTTTTAAADGEFNGGSVATTSARSISSSPNINASDASNFHKTTRWWGVPLTEMVGRNSLRRLQPTKDYVPVIAPWGEVLFYKPSNNTNSNCTNSADGDDECVSQSTTTTPEFNLPQMAAMPWQGPSNNDSYRWWESAFDEPDYDINDAECREELNSVSNYASLSSHSSAELELSSAIQLDSMNYEEEDGDYDHHVDDDFPSCYICVPRKCHQPTERIAEDPWEDEPIEDEIAENDALLISRNVDDVNVVRNDNLDGDSSREAGLISDIPGDDQETTETFDLVESGTKEKERPSTSRWGRVPSTILVDNDEDKVQIDTGALVTRWDDLKSNAQGQTETSQDQVYHDALSRRANYSPSDMTDLLDDNADEQIDAKERYIPLQQIESAANLWNKVLLNSYLKTTSPLVRSKIARYLRARIRATQSQNHQGVGGPLALPIAESGKEEETAAHESSTEQETSSAQESASSDVDRQNSGALEPEACDSSESDLPCRRCERIEAGGRQASRICRLCGNVRAKRLIESK